MTRSNVSSPANDTKKQSSSYRSSPSFKTPSKLIYPSTIDFEKQINNENITFVCHNLPSESNSNLINFFQSINHNIKTFTDSNLCFDWIKSSNDLIFLISSSTNKDFLTSLHQYNNIQAIFILNTKVEIDENDFSKLIGIFNQSEELIMIIQDMLNCREEDDKREMFTFEGSNVFLWTQLWKEERTSKKNISTKMELIDMAQNVYHDNTKILKSINIFNDSYQSNDVFHWCLYAPFPSTSLKTELYTHNNEQLHFYSFLLNDASRYLNKQQPKRNSIIQFFRGMKLPNDILDKIEKNTGKLICTNGFFVCTKSRTTAMAVASSSSSSSQYSDLSPVLFKIDCDPSIPFVEIPKDKNSLQVIFDVYTTFRILCVNRGQITIIKIKIANDDGKQIAKEYKKKHNETNVQILLNQLLLPVKSSNHNSSYEIQAEEHLARNEFQLAVTAYRQILPVTPRILNKIAQIFTENLHDTHSALVCYIQALKLQEEKGEDITETLTNLGIIYHNQQKYDLALSHHSRALKLREAANPPDLLLIANNLRSIARTQYAQQQLSEALENGEKALKIYQSLKPMNENNLVPTLSILANIYHEYKDHNKAIQLATQALTLFEQSTLDNSYMLASLCNNLGTYHLSLGTLNEARKYYEKALNSCIHIISPEHPKRIFLENQIQEIIQMQEKQ